jgi:hypothetical protein
MSSVDDEPSDGYAISSFPNPASGSTTFRLRLPIRSLVKIAVVDGSGHEVDIVAWRAFEAGGHSLPYDAALLSSGVYAIALEAGTIRVVGTMTIIK